MHDSAELIARERDLAPNRDPAAGIGTRIAELRKTIAATEIKRRNIDDALATRKAALNRLLAAAALHGAGTAPSNHG